MKVTGAQDDGRRDETAVHRRQVLPVPRTPNRSGHSRDRRARRRHGRGALRHDRSAHVLRTRGRRPTNVTSLRRSAVSPVKQGTASRRRLDTTWSESRPLEVTVMVISVCLAPNATWCPFSTSLSASTGATKTVAALLGRDGFDRCHLSLSASFGDRRVGQTAPERTRQSRHRSGGATPAARRSRRAGCRCRA